jgi:alkanesulfonate monooxygenase SsuD/methylene tetrahydromethanopterin reductase-like flavin-dependent oxidoreductase (luciferase family)
VSTNPVILDLYFGMKTKRMKFGQLGCVLPSQNPINLAENIAMVSQMLNGRVFAGFARGYQPRWVNVGQRRQALLHRESADRESQRAGGGRAAHAGKRIRREERSRDDVGQGREELR